MEKMDLIGAFPIPIQIYRYEYSIEKELKYIENLEWRGNASNSTSMDGYLNEHESLNSVTSFFKECLNDYCDTILNSDQRLVITQQWANRNPKGSEHPIHTHPNSIISGVFYLRQNPTLPPIYFFNDNMDTFGLHPREHNCYTSGSFDVICESGELIMFPSSLRHSVPVNTGEEDRISLAFNTFCADVMGREDQVSLLDIRKIINESN
tara:strand:- start:169 stop:792 length:624 start_codon:yes stop_codon:yes gene_type:complete